MNIRKNGTRSLSLLLALTLSVSMWVGDFQTVLATENMAAQDVQDSTGSNTNSDADNGTNSDANNGTNGNASNSTGSNTNNDASNSTGSNTNNDASNGTNNGTGTDKVTQVISGNGDNVNDGDDTDNDTDNNNDSKKATTLTDEDIEKISVDIYDALYEGIEKRFCEKWRELCDSSAAECGLDDEDNEEITDELYAQFYAALYESSCTLLDDVLTEELDAAGEQKAYADLQNEAVYQKVYGNIRDKLYEEYVKGLNEMGISTPDNTASDPGSNSPAGFNLADEVGVTGIKVTVDGVTLLEGTSNIIDLSDSSKVNVLTGTEISVEMNFELLKGVGDPNNGGIDISNRKIRGGDSYTVTVPEGLIMTAFGGVIGDGRELTTASGLKVADAKLIKDSNGTSIRITFNDNINAGEGYYDVKYGLSMKMQLDKGKLKDQATTVAWTSINALGGPDYSFTLPAAPANKPDGVTKRGDYNAANNEITWTIEIKGTTGVDIGGWTIVDTLDTSCQTYKSASFTSGGTTETVEYTSSSSTTGSSGGSTSATEYAYEIPEGTKIPATLKIVTTPTPETLAKLVDSSTTSDIGIDNSVALKDTGNNNTLNASGTVTLPHTTPISKTGEPVSADLMQWTLTANPDKAYIYGATVTDKLQSYLHLAGNEAGTEKYITIAGNKVTLTKGSSTNEWKGSSTDSNIECTYKENGDSSGNNILTINFVDGKGTLAGKSSTITFETSIDLDAASRYTDGSMKVTNIAEIECRFPEGKSGKNTSYGTGPVEWTVSQNMIKKSASKDTKGGYITWEITPSIGTKTFTEAVITDEIDQGGSATSKQTLKKDSIKLFFGGTDITESEQYKGYFKIEYGYDSSDTGKTNPIKVIITLKGKSDGASTGFSSEELNKIKITYQTHMDGLGTTVQDGTAKEQTYYNEASLKVDACSPVSDKASVEVKDNMLSKNSATYYEELADGRVMRGYKYTITVNSMGIKISNSNGDTPVVLTDDLSKIQPSYSTAAPATQAELALYKVAIFKGNTEIYSREVENTCDYYTYSGSAKSLGKLETTEQFSKLAEDGSTVKVDLYVVITNADQFFKQDIKLQAGNEASVAVTTDTGSGTFKAAAAGTDAGSTINNDLITKTASSKEAQPGVDKLYSDWSICINPWSANMGDITITDRIPKEQASYVTFDYDSVKLYEATHSTTGGVYSSSTEATVSHDVKIEENASGDMVLTVTIPKCTKTYYLKYRTYYLDQKLGASYKNTVSLGGSDISDAASYEIQVTASAWATANRRASLTVKKLGKDADGNPTAISGTPFALYDENGFEIQKRSTDENGQIVFSGLVPDKKYRLREIGAGAADVVFYFDKDRKMHIVSGETDQIIGDEDDGIVTIITTLKDKEGSEKPSGQDSRHEDNNDAEAVTGTDYSANDSSFSTNTVASTVQSEAAEADGSELGAKEGRNVKTEDQTPIALYLVLAVVTLGAFVILTLILKKKKSK